MNRLSSTNGLTTWLVVFALLLTGYSSKGQIISTVCGNGTPGYNGEGIAATSAQVSGPWGICVSNSGDIYFSEWGNQRIRKISGGIITTIAGDGTGAFLGEGTAATAAEIHNPQGVAVDAAGNVYRADAVNERVRKVSPSGIITTIAGIGTLGYGGDGGPATAAQFNEDMNCSAIDAYGNLYVADPINNRVRKISYSSLGLQQTAQVDMGINISPNPATNEVAISAAMELKSIVVLDAQGREVRHLTCNNTHTTIDVADLPKGTYFVKVNGAYGGQFVKE